MLLNCQKAGRQRGFHGQAFHRRFFSTTRWTNRCKIECLEKLEPRVTPRYSPVATQSLYSMTWETPPRNVCLVKKPWNSKVRDALTDFIKHLDSSYKGVNVIVEKDVAEEIENDLNNSVTIYTGSQFEIKEKTDLLVTLGGDGTILNAASLFASGDVPPVLSFSMGTLGFLMPFDYKDSYDAFHSLYTSQSMVLKRSRLDCEATYQGSRAGGGKEAIKTHAMNDLTIHRGQEPHLSMVDISVDGVFVTTAIADGITVSTPTGSTAYSLSSGGSIVHPAVPCILITPICPRSLSFRPLIVPASATLTLNVSERSRARAADLSVDGLRQGTLRAGDVITVGSEQGDDKGIWCVAKSSSDWIQQLNGLLGFNSPFGGR